MTSSETFDATQFKPYEAYNTALLSGDPQKMARCLRLMEVKIAQVTADLSVLTSMRATLVDLLGEEESRGEKKRAKRKEADVDLHR